MNPAANIIPLFVVIPLSGAFLTAIFGKKIKRAADFIAVFSCASLFVSAVIAFKALHPFPVLVYSVGSWKPPIGISMVLDGLSAFMVVTVNLVAFFISVYAVNYMERYTGKWKFYTLFLLMLGGMNGVIVTGDIFNMYVFLEITSVASFALIAFGLERQELEAAFKYAIMSTLGSLFILLAIALLYGFTSTLNMADMASVLAQKGPSNIVRMISVLLIMGFGLKAALVPFHAWLPDAHPAAPAPISAMLSGILIKSLGIYTLCRVFCNVIGMTPTVSSVLMFLAAVTMVVGGFLAIGQWDIKRLWACSSISQMGYIVLGIGLGTPLGVFGALFHLFNHSIFKSLLFLDSGAVEYSTGTRDLKKLGGLMTPMPVTGRTTLIGAMSISGIPPFNGFWSKLIIILAAVQAGKFWYAFWAVFASLLTLTACLKVLKQAFWGPLPETLKEVKEVPVFMRFSVIALSLVCLFAGVLIIPGIAGGFLDRASGVILEGVNYAMIVLKGIS